MKQTRFVTVDDGDTIIRGLYQAGAPSALQRVEILVAVASEDAVNDVTFTIFVERLGDTPPAFRHPNGDVVLATRAYVEPGGEPFEVTLCPPIGHSHVTGATVRLGPQAEAVMSRYLASKSRND